MHGGALLAKENANLRQANEKIRQKRTRTHRQAVAEGGQLAQQLIALAEAEQPVTHAQGDSAIQEDPRPKRASPRCSGCWELGHKTNHCKKR